MSFMNRAKAAAEQVRAKAQEGVGEVQARKELAQAYWDLGHKAHELASRGEISNPELDPLVARITELLDRDEQETQQASTPPTGSSSPAEPASTPAEPVSPVESAPPVQPASPAEPEQATDATPPQTPA
jgi:hypothetical protein